MRLPVAPPARPVAITGLPSSFSARATLTPLPPADGRRLDGAVAMAEPEVRDGDRAVDRRVQRDGENQLGSNLSLPAETIAGPGLIGGFSGAGASRPTGTTTRRSSADARRARAAPRRPAARPGSAASMRSIRLAASAERVARSGTRASSAPSTVTTAVAEALALLHRAPRPPRGRRRRGPRPPRRGAPSASTPREPPPPEPTTSRSRIATSSSRSPSSSTAPRSRARARSAGARGCRRRAPPPRERRSGRRRRSPRPRVPDPTSTYPAPSVNPVLTPLTNGNSRTRLLRFTIRRDLRPLGRA